jgi:hypothetical protein
MSVGGYALGNSRYNWWSGPETGQDVVPWFGGVYTRLDMTFLENWDFSLQYNNDSFFDSTGFARLTYRMGGSRRRNVPDQMEQPMMRNEHIVRAHQTPTAAINPVTGQAWNVIHVDDTAAAFGDGTAETPYRTLAEAQAAAVNPYDVVFVQAGASAVTPYASTWQFQADNQILVGEGSTLQLATTNCGYEQFFTGSGGVRPVLTSAGTAITLRNGAVVDHFGIVDAPVGITADASHLRWQRVRTGRRAGRGRARGHGQSLQHAGHQRRTRPLGRRGVRRCELPGHDHAEGVDGRERAGAGRDRWHGQHQSDPRYAQRSGRNQSGLAVARLRRIRR